MVWAPPQRSGEGAWVPPEDGADAVLTVGDQLSDTVGTDRRETSECGPAIGVIVPVIAPLVQRLHMPRTELATAGDLLASAAEDAGPDHGRLARIEAKLDTVQTSESDEVAVAIDEALDEIHAYRETVEGV